VREQVLYYIRERRLLKAGDRVGVAISGGADSVALLRVLLELREELGVVLHVAHFNHQLRGQESDGDERFVAELAGRFDLLFFAGRGDVRGHAQANKLSLEHAARDLRYQWLTDLACNEKFAAIATAHNADDQAETVLMKFLRGAGTKGLAGIYPMTEVGDVPVIRPLLQSPRAAIEHYLRDLNQTWREDHTNRDTQRLRNRVRHELLPLLEREFNPGLRQALGETAEIARGEEEFWQRLYEGQSLEKHTLDLPMRKLDRLPVGAQRRLFKTFLEKNEIPADFHHIERLRHCANGEISTTTTLPGGWRAHFEGRRLQLIPPTQLEPQLKSGYEYGLRIRGCCNLPELGLTVRAILVSAEIASSEAPGTLLRLGRLGQLTVRNWLPGDRFRPAHSGSEEKLKRLFSEKKVPAEQRSLWPVVLNKHNRIVWVRGFPVAHDFAWTPGAGDAVKIEVLPINQPDDAT
jgi:tRNA(Ile)-lysidine synthase